MKEAFSTPLQGYDALRILTQILSFQTIHYLILATLVPPMLAIFAETSSLMFEGGPTQVGMVFDWRQIAGRPTYDWTAPRQLGEIGWTEDGKQDEVRGEVVVDPAVLVRWNLDNVWLDEPLIRGASVQDKVLDHDDILRFKTARNTTTSSHTTSTSTPISDNTSVQEALQHWEWSHTRDSARSYTLMFTWLLTIPLDILLLVYLVRRPTHMLDHALTLHLINLVVSSYYTRHLPTAFRWWLTMLVHAALLVVWSEQLAIKREMGRSLGYSLVGNGLVDQELGTKQKPPPHVVFDADHDSYELRRL